MNSLTLLLALLGLAGFAAGVVLSASGQKETGVVLMGLGLVFQVISLVRIRRAKREAGSNARG